MTEDGWLSATYPTPMLDFLRGQASDRKLRLFGVACCLTARRRDPEGPDVDCVARLADGADNLEEVRREWAPYHLEGSYPERPFEWCAAFASLAPDRISAPGDAVDLSLPTTAELVGLLHEVFGNPFRPVAFDPAWRTTDVRLLASGIYDEKAFDRMPILADALQDAGCDAGDLLNHLRDTHAGHGRWIWCWAEPDGGLAGEVAVSRRATIPVARGLRTGGSCPSVR